MDEQKLRGKVALVTGAGKNIGRAVAHHMARQGASVVVNGRGDQAAVDAVVAELNGVGAQAIGCMADVTDAGAVGRMADQAIAAFGGLDIVVSNAGLRRQTPFLSMTLEEWREILSVALDGAFILARATLPHLVRRGGGAFVALSGVSTHVGTPDRCHVSASKAGLEGLVRALAIELAPHRITCNCVSPGPVDTVRGASAGALPSSMQSRPTPIGRKATVDEIAAMVTYLAGPHGTIITGQTIHVNGGLFLT